MTENLLIENAAAETGSCGTTPATDAADTSAAGGRVQETFQVSGMTCGHCVGAVTAELTKLAGVTNVTVDLATGRVTVDSDLPLAPADVAEAIDEAGYELADQVSV